MTITNLENKPHTISEEDMKVIQKIKEDIENEFKTYKFSGQTQEEAKKAYEKALMETLGLPKEYVVIEIDLKGPKQNEV